MYCAMVGYSANCTDPPALVEPLLASRKRPFFFNMKLPPMKIVELTASAKPM